MVARRAAAKVSWGVTGAKERDPQEARGSMGRQSPPPAAKARAGMCGSYNSSSSLLRRWFGADGAADGDARETQERQARQENNYENKTDMLLELIGIDV